jgi:ABC-type sugar transport system ATPase subunit
LSADGQPYLRVRGVSKRFGHIQALRDVNVEVRTGEVMGLVGENGAGKSTLVKILSGMVRPDRGSIELAGKPAEIADLQRSSDEVAVVQQELSLVESMSVAENIFLGDPATSAFRSPRRQARRAVPLLEMVGLGAVDPHREVRTLSVAERQLVEIARLISRNAGILIFDEPTAALAETEIERIGELVRRLAADGRAVIYVSHHLDEIFALCDRVTVFRDGQSAEPADVSSLSVDGLIQRMLGRPLERMFPPRSERGGRGRDHALVLAGVCADGLVGAVDLEVRAGEIVGLAGQMGSGCAAMLRAVGGVQPLTAGEIVVAGEPLKKAGTESAMKAGIAYCSNDRKLDGIFATRSVAENLTAPAIRLISPRGWRSRQSERALAEELASRFQIHRHRLRSRANTLSGGNQQKVAVGKLAGIRPRVMLIDEPTRGVDVGARAEIYAHLRRLADQGMAIVFASSDTAEVVGLADRVVTFYRGEVVSVYDGEAADAERVTRDITHRHEAERMVPAP